MKWQRVWRRGNVAVSFVLNPFCFPLSHRFYFPEAVNALGVNCGENNRMLWGQFPLVVFTDGGIWAMKGADNASGAPFDGKVMVSPLVNVCRKPVAFSGGFFFACRGAVMMLKGQRVEVLSAGLAGDRDSTLLGEACIGYLMRNCSAELGSAALVALGGSAETGKMFNEHVVMAYDHVRDELLVSNTAAGFTLSLVCQVAEAKWHTTDLQMLSLCGSYAVCTATDVSGGSKIVTLAAESKAPVPVCLFSRPFALCNGQYAQVQHLALLGHMQKGENGMPGMYLLGSNNLGDWVLCQGSQWNDKNVGVAIMPRTANSFRFFAFAMWGDVQPGSQVQAILIDYKRKYGGRMR